MSSILYLQVRSYNFCCRPKFSSFRVSATLLHHKRVLVLPRVPILIITKVSQTTDKVLFIGLQLFMGRVLQTLLLVQIYNKQLTGSWTWVVEAGIEKQLYEHCVQLITILSEPSTIFTMYEKIQIKIDRVKINKNVTISNLPWPGYPSYS